MSELLRRLQVLFAGKDSLILNLNEDLLRLGVENIGDLNFLKDSDL